MPGVIPIELIEGAAELVMCLLAGVVVLLNLVLTARV